MKKYFEILFVVSFMIVTSCEEKSSTEDDCKPHKNISIKEMISNKSFTTTEQFFSQRLCEENNMQSSEDIPQIVDEIFRYLVLSHNQRILERHFDEISMMIKSKKNLTKDSLIRVANEKYIIIPDSITIIIKSEKGVLQYDSIIKMQTPRIKSFINHKTFVKVIRLSKDENKLLLNELYAESLKHKNMILNEPLLLTLLKRFLIVGEPDYHQMKFSVINSGLEMPITIWHGIEDYFELEIYGKPTGFNKVGGTWIELPIGEINRKQEELL